MQSQKMSCLGLSTAYRTCTLWLCLVVALWLSFSIVMSEMVMGSPACRKQNPCDCCPREKITQQLTPSLEEPTSVAPVMEERGRKYAYPDTDWRIPCWLDGFESRVSSAMDPEMHLWVRAQAFLEKIGDGVCYHTRYDMQDSGEGRLVDVGCGLGRIVLRYGPLFREVDCLEPDDVRRSTARNELSKSYESWSHGRVSFHGTRFLDWVSEGSADAVTIIHVVQHIPSYEVPKWLKKIRMTLGLGGIMVLATTISYRGHSYFTLDDGSEVDEHQYNQHADSPKATLAVRRFDEKDLKKLVTDAGMHILENGPFMFHKKSGVAESQYIIATRATDAHLWQHCAPLEYMRPPRFANFHLISLQNQWRARHDHARYCR
mmetsp:Transcript_27846/g.62942  ORF Transcript_27846/g.62942 Transcript_27846/m.62942 type:complete len:374 (+) Transcript_27846:102-1223(+)